MERKSTKIYYCNSAKPWAGSCWRLRDFSKEITLSTFPGFILSPQCLPSASTEDRTGIALTYFSTHFTETNLIFTRGRATISPEVCWQKHSYMQTLEIKQTKKLKEKQNEYIRKQINAVKSCCALEVKADLAWASQYWQPSVIQKQYPSVPWHVWGTH